MKGLSQLLLARLFDARAPRYTSYPTAAKFSDAVGPGEFAGWVGAVPAGARVSLYLHVPFCSRLCWFCACRTQGTRTAEPVRAYVETLRAELALLRRHLPQGVQLERLHWGGGTPTLLSPELIRGLAAAVFEVAPMAPGGKFSVEIDPSEVDAARLDALRDVGMNRASIGVQDFHPAIQAAIGREQSYERTRQVVEMLRARGIASLNCDILYGLPHQTEARIGESVAKLLTLGPDRVALYGYAHVPWMAKRQVLIDTSALPGPKDRLALFETARGMFEAAGYDAVGIDHFARPGDGLALAARAGRLRRNFQGYTDDTAPILIGVGASAISRFPQGFAQNAATTSRHVAAIRAGGFSTARGHAFGGDDRMRGRMIEALMCDFRVDTDAIVCEFGVAPEVVIGLLRKAAAGFEEVVTVTAAGLDMAPEARVLARVLARVMDGYEMPVAGQSLAI